MARIICARCQRKEPLLVGSRFYQREEGGEYYCEDCFPLGEQEQQKVEAAQHKIELKEVYATDGEKFFAILNLLHKNVEQQADIAKLLGSIKGMLTFFTVLVILGIIISFFANLFLG